MTSLQKNREQRGMTREQLSKSSRIALSKIYLYENSKGNPTARTLAKLAKALDCKVSDLIE